MEPDINGVLRGAAHLPDDALDLGDIRRRAQRLRLRRRAAFGGAAVMAVALAVTLIAPGLLREQRSVEFTNEPPPAVAPTEARTPMSPADKEEEAHKDKARMERRRCSGGPRIRLRPSFGPPGTRVQFSGTCFVGAFSDAKELMKGYGIFLIRPAAEAPGRSCELIGGAQPAKLVIRDGDGRGYFTVPRDGGCFQEQRTERFVPGRYYVGLGYHTGFSDRTTFKVTPRVAADDVCGPEDVELALPESEGVMRQTAVFIRLQLTGRARCRVDTNLTATVLKPDGSVFPADENPANHRLSGVLTPESPELVLWGWGSNGCTRAPLRLRLEAAGYGERTDTVDDLLSGVGGDEESCEARFRVTRPPG